MPLYTVAEVSLLSFVPFIDSLSAFCKGVIWWVSGWTPWRFWGFDDARLRQLRGCLPRQRDRRCSWNAHTFQAMCFAACSRCPCIPVVTSVPNSKPIRIILKTGTLTLCRFLCMQCDRCEKDEQQAFHGWTS